jgi:Na+-translocating ferredoxin:NAD+ oxidoreductase RnfG subunit
VLLVICAVAAAVLAAVDGITSDRIAAQTAARVQQALKHVLPEADEFKDATEVLLQVKAETSAQGKPFLAIVDRMYIGYSQDEQRGFVFICLPSGYGGVIETACVAFLRVNDSKIILHGNSLLRTCFDAYSASDTPDLTCLSYLSTSGS